MSAEQLQELVARIRERRPETPPPIAEARANYDLLARVFPVGEDIACEPIRIGARAAEWVGAPGADPGYDVDHLTMGARRCVRLGRVLCRCPCARHAVTAG